jgi:hypothetical protein
VPDSPACGSTRALWRVCVCLLLIGLVLYNPFVALNNHSNGLSCHRLPRHRATVGSSEMQHFTPVQGAYALTEGIVEDVLIELSAPKNEVHAWVIPDEPTPRQPELIASICFRPPPALQLF